MARAAVGEVGVMTRTFPFSPTLTIVVLLCLKAPSNALALSSFAMVGLLSMPLIPHKAAAPTAVFFTIFNADLPKD